MEDHQAFLPASIPAKPLLSAHDYLLAASYHPKLQLLITNTQ
jgi:hypothetical protein